MSEVTPLFVIEENGNRKSVIPKITAEKETLDPADLIVLVATDLAKDSKDAGNVDTMGEMTLSGHLLLETLHRIGNKKQADSIANDLSELYKSSYLFMLGMRAGRILPEEMKIETAFYDGDTRLRVESKEGDYNPDEVADD